MVREIDSSKLPEWQKELSDDLKLSKISIPGTHNSEACHTSLPSVQCQNASISEQLNHGVRFFDLRLGREPATTALSSLTSTITAKISSLMSATTTTTTDTAKTTSAESTDDTIDTELYVVHDKYPVKLPYTTKLEEVLNEFYAFLDKHPSEAVMVSMKLEGEGEWKNDSFPTLLWDKYLQPKKDKWYLKNDIPKLGDIRGKLFFFRRFGWTKEKDEWKSGYGFDAHYWTYNTTADDQGTFVVQDWCEIEKPEDVEKKAQYVKELCEKANKYLDQDGKDDKLFINFCSGSYLFDKECWPENISISMNKNGLTSFFKKSCGIIIMDFVATNDFADIKALINQNF